MLRIKIFQLKKTIISCKTQTKAYQVINFLIVRSMLERDLNFIISDSEVPEIESVNNDSEDKENKEDNGPIISLYKRASYLIL